MQYAKDTSVPVEKSRAEIESVVGRYGATGFMSGWMGTRAMVAFEMRGRRLRFLLDLPARDERRFTHYRRGRALVTEHARQPDEARKAWEQACRQKWRALALLVKAKLEAVESAISEFDQEMLPYLVLPDGMTVAEKLVPRLPEMLAGADMPPLLPGPPS